MRMSRTGPALLPADVAQEMEEQGLIDVEWEDEP